MADIRVNCPCGNEMVMSEFAVGMRTTCPVCGHPLTVNWQNSRPLDSDAHSSAAPVAEEVATRDASPFAAEKPEETPRAGKHHCDRCGRPFRGDWDRHQTGQGMLCHICVNLVRQVDPTDTSSGYIAPIDTLRLETAEEFAPPPAVPMEGEQTWMDKYWPVESTMQKIALYGGIAVIVIALLVFITSGFDVPQSDPNNVVPGESVEVISEQAGVAYWAIAAFTNFFGVYLGLYLFLSWGNRLPNETLTLNLIALAPVALVAALLWLIPFGGWLFVLILVFTMYGFEWGDILRFPVSCFVAGIFKFFLWLTLYGLLGIVAT